MIFIRRQIILFLVAAITLFSGDRKVLLEMFTNAHCYSCVAAYELFRQYNISNPLAVKTAYVFYHIAQPGVEDSIYYENRTDSETRNNYYGPFATAPLLFMDGSFVGNNVKTWQQSILSRYQTSSPFEITIAGTYEKKSFTIEAQVKQTGDVSENDLRIHIILTESVGTYIGKNGVTPQVYAMRKMLTGSSGESFSIAKGESKKIVKRVTLYPGWVDEKMYAVVFIQSNSSKTVYQSEMKSLTFFLPTLVSRVNNVPNLFLLDQNYPNPFNPSTNIRFSLATEGETSLRIYNLLGNEVATLVSERLSSGTYDVRFDGSDLSTGMYFYRLHSNGSSTTRKMHLIK